MTLITVIAAPVLVLVGVLVGHWVARKRDKEQNRLGLVTELNETKLENRRLDFEVLKETVAELKAQVQTLSAKVDTLSAKLDLITSKYWRLVHHVRDWIGRHGIDKNELPDDIQSDI